MTTAAAKGDSSKEEEWTVGRLLQWTTGFFTQHAVENPRLDVEVLLSHVLQCQRIELYANYNSPVDDTHRAQFRQLVRERSAGCPVAYLVGYREFFTLKFDVNRSVLIPRPETEHLVVEAITHLRSKENGRLLDLGTGSGAIAVTLAHECPDVTGIAVDLSPEALEVARGNAEKNEVGDRIEFLVSDLFEQVPRQTFDLIASNPPYVATEEYDSLERSTKDFEPRLALDGGPGGISIIQRIVRDAPAWLNPGGKLLMEIGATHEPLARKVFDNVTGFQLGPTVRDLAGKPRLLVADFRGD